jgi:anti-anti-sigma regulatory factor
MLKKKGGDLRLLRVSRRVENLLAMLKLLMLFQRFDDEDAAVRSFARPA